MNLKNNFTTGVDVPAFVKKINQVNPVFLSGSCFTEHIAQKLERYKYKVCSNPFGILYNPVSMARSLQRIADLKAYHPNELVFHQGLYHSLDHHGQFSSTDPEEVILKINANMTSAHDALKKCDYAFFSPGTAKVYHYRSSNTIVGNCHKIPANNFTHELLSLSACEHALDQIYSAVKQLNPHCQIVWTVSPVRHVKDGLIENQRSKSTLLLSIMQHIEKHPDVGYFPAYEIMMDELRDYRYYARDMIHPSPLAIDIIWETFESTFAETEAHEQHAAIEKIKRAMEHRILNNDVAATNAFALRQVQIIEQLDKKYPGLDWEEEKYYFENLIQRT